MFLGKIIRLIFSDVSFFLVIMSSILVTMSFTAVKSQTPENPGPWIPPVSNIRVSRGVGSTAGTRKLLSVGADGSYADLYDKDDKSGRQQWVFQRSSDGRSYNILVDGGTTAGRKYLSATPDGLKVNLVGQDDGSGRQRWIMEAVRQASGSSSSLPYYSFHIIVQGGVANNRKYLSTSADSKIVDLYHTDDASGRQLWVLNPPSGKKFNLQISGGISTGSSFMGKTSTEYFPALYPSDDNSGRQRWTIDRVGANTTWNPTYRETYNIWTPGSNAGVRLLLQGKTQVYMAVPETITDMSFGFDQIWVIEDIGSGLVRIKKNSLYMGVSTDGTKVVTSNLDDGSGRQRWRIVYAR